MAKLVWKTTAGQDRVRSALGNAFANDSLGHAYLFSGAAGVGKFSCARELAMAMLCEAGDPVPCHECESCRQVRHYAHPDFHMVMPVVLHKEQKSADGKLSQAGWEAVAQSCREKLEDPYALADWPGLPVMPVEWIREVNHAILRGPIKAKRTVTIFGDVDMMRQESANAMLKTLEEPPPGTLLILMTERIHAVLPTILSRCQIIRFGYIAEECIREELARRFDDQRDGERVVRAAQSADGSLGRALRLYRQPLDALIEEARTLWELCMAPDWLQRAQGFEALIARALDDGRDYRTCEKIFSYAGDLIRDSVLTGMADTEKYIRNEFVSPALASRRMSPETANTLLAICQDAVSGMRARGNIMMALVAFSIRVRAALHEAA
jgi:DNA polymerase-3 subunit delta'